jgi:hypothetical protein
MEKPDDVVTFLETAIEKWLRTDWKSLKSSPSNKKAGELLDRCDQLPAPSLAQWSKDMPPLVWTAKGKESGQKTWCLSHRRLSVALAGEVALERKIVNPVTEGWWAQVPAVSGFNVSGAAKRSIDLVQETGNREFRFIELKTNLKTNNPIYAAIELILYGIFYSHIRANAGLRSKLNKDSAKLLDATAVEFAVLAPREYYEKSLTPVVREAKLLEFGGKLSDAFANLGGSTVRMSFAFRVFDENAALRQAFKEARVLGS